MKKFKEGMKVTVSVCGLYERYGEDLTYHSIKYTPIGVDSVTCEYFDILDDLGNVVCMDGETCIVDQVGQALVTLRNNEGECTEYITLTMEEAEVGVLVNL